VNKSTAQKVPDRAKAQKRRRQIRPFTFCQHHAASLRKTLFCVMILAPRLFTQTNAAVDIFMQPSRNESGDDAAVIKWLAHTSACLAAAHIWCACRRKF